MTVTDMLNIIMASVALFGGQYIFHLEKKYPTYKLKSLSPTALFSRGDDEETTIRRRYVAMVMLCSSAVIYLINAVVNMVTN